MLQEELFRKLQELAISPIESRIEINVTPVGGSKQIWVDQDKVKEIRDFIESKFGSPFGLVTPETIEREVQARRYVEELGWDYLALYEPYYFRIVFVFDRGARDFWKDKKEAYGLAAAASEDLDQSLIPKIYWEYELEKEKVTISLVFPLSYGS